jgi:hypothetical protein
MRKMALAAAIAVALCAPALVLAAGIPGATVTVVNPADSSVFDVPRTTDAEGAFAFDNVPTGSWRLDVITADLAKNAQVLFAVPLDKDLGHLAGRVTALEGADISLEVNAAITAAGAPLIVLDEGYPRVQPAWNRNWAHANGRLIVRLAGTGLEGLEKVVLTNTSTAGSIETTAIVQDPMDGEYHAIFAKKAAYAALVPAGAVRGDVVAITVGLTTAVGTGTFDASFRIVGPKRPHPHF